jgi:hypothetical protein
MTAWDWIGAATRAIAIKIIETIVSENIRKQVSQKESTAAFNLLLDLYEQITALEHDSAEFSETLNDFTKQWQDVPDSHKFSVLWRFGWGGILLRQANEVARGIETVSRTVQSLSPQAQIYFPEVVDFVDYYEQIAQAEVYLSEDLRHKGEKLRSLTIGEIQELGREIEEAVTELTRAKEVLAGFMREEFTFKESL